MIVNNPRISVVFSTRKIDDVFVEHVKKTCLYKGVEVLPYENNNEYSLTTLYNRGLAEAKADIVVFCHDDIVFETKNWGEKILKHFEKNEEYGILGVAGTNHMIDGRWWTIKNAMHGTVKHSHGSKVWTNKYSESYGNQIKEMVAVDGLFIAVNKTKIKKTFNESFGGFHFYDIPFCLENHLLGVKVGLVSNILLLHKSIGETNENWESGKKKFEDLYSNHLPICLEESNKHIIFDKELPKIHLHVLCWNEEKIIPYFLKHYENYVDKIFVYDNKSSDGSVKLLKKHPKTIVMSYNTNGEIRDDAYLDIKNNAWRSTPWGDDGPDIVIICDMDEFLYSDNLKNYILDFNSSDSTIIKPEGYDMIVKDFDFDYNFNLTDLVKTGYRETKFDKLVMFKPKEITEINYNFGCHVASPRGNVKFFEKPIKLLHYKRLGLNYFLSKMAIYKKRISKFNRDRKLGFEYEYQKDIHTKQFLLDYDKKNIII